MTDVTARYASDWLTVARRNRVDESWWEETLRPFRTPNMFEIMEENEDISGTGSSKVWLLKYYSCDGYAISLPMQLLTAPLDCLKAVGLYCTCAETCCPASYYFHFESIELHSVNFLTRSMC